MTRQQHMRAFPRKQSDYERVIRSVKHSLSEGCYEGRMLPTYRQLIRELNVTMGTISRAMAALEREGLIRRENGRGVFPRAQSHSPAPEEALRLQCINFAIHRFSLAPSFIEADYLEGYTGLLENHAVRMRFIASSDLEFSHDRLFSQTLPIAAQGAVLVNSRSPELMEWLRRNGVPFVVQYNTRYLTEGLPPHFGVYVNKAGGAFKAVNYLLELGHRRIGFMGEIDRASASRAGIPPSGMVFEGYRAALIGAGVDCVECAEGDLAYHCDAGKRRTGFVAVAKSFLNRPQRPTAILACCDEYALALLDAARELNIRVPEDLSIVGFDNQPGSAQADPPLTTVSIPRRELARSAVELLLEASEGPQVPPRTLVLDTHLIIRETTAPPPNPGGQRD